MHCFPYMSCACLVKCNDRNIAKASDSTGIQNIINSYMIYVIVSSCSLLLHIYITLTCVQCIQNMS